MTSTQVDLVTPQWTGFQNYVPKEIKNSSDQIVSVVDVSDSEIVIGTGGGSVDSYDGADNIIIGNGIMINSSTGMYISGCDGVSISGGGGDAELNGNHTRISGSSRIELNSGSVQIGSTGGLVEIRGITISITQGSLNATLQSTMIDGSTAYVFKPAP